jgi:predicted secreted hydrolase
MDLTNYVTKKSRTISARFKGIISFLIILLMIVPSISVSAEKSMEYKNSESPWKVYPFRPPGTQICFPNDEGAHDIHQFPIEWWYANFQLIGQTTGQEYGSFVAFYHVQSTVIENQEVRIFSISDISAEKTYTNAQIGTLTASNDHLDLSFKHISDYNENNNLNAYAIANENFMSTNQETNMNIDSMETTMEPLNWDTTESTTQTQNIQKANTISNITGEADMSNNDFLQDDRWFTKTNDQGLIPFQYTLIASGNSQQDRRPMGLAVDMDCIKQPLLVGADGVINFESYDFSYYYSLTRLAVTGVIKVHGITEEVTGYSWIDHQWGNFINQNPPPYGLTMTYEWLSMQFNDNKEIMVGDAWNRKTGEKLDQSYTGGLNLVNSDGSLELLEDYTITQLAFWNDTQDNRFFSAAWHITETSKAIDLTITPVYFNQVIRIKENCKLFQQFIEELLPSACFWEGVCSVSGFINGISVNGKAYIELTHSYESVDKIDLPLFKR